LDQLHGFVRCRTPTCEHTITVHSLWALPPDETGVITLGAGERTAICDGCHKSHTYSLSEAEELAVLQPIADGQ
jgi:hypothetical protein